MISMIWLRWHLAAITALSLSEYNLFFVVAFFFANSPLQLSDLILFVSEMIRISSLSFRLDFKQSVEMVSPYKIRVPIFIYFILCKFTIVRIYPYLSVNMCCPCNCRSRLTLKKLEIFLNNHYLLLRYACIYCALLFACCYWVITGLYLYIHDPFHAY